MFALIVAFIMILVATSALTLRAAFALALLVMSALTLLAASALALLATSALTLLAAFALTEDFFDLNKMIKKMSKFFKDSF